MKKLLICILPALLACVAGCYKDEGNYSYSDINEISFSNIDTTNGYSVLLGDSLKISPVLNSTLAGNENNYTYEWSFYNQITGDKVISKEKNLRVRIEENPGVYSLQYRVVDNNSGILFHVRTNVTVKTAVFEGYMVLNEVDGKSRLDMLSYDATAGSFIQITDVLTMMGSNLPEQGKPFKVVCTRTSNAFNWSDSTYGIYLLTETGTNRINAETFSWNPTYNIRYEIAGNIPDDFKADNLVPDPAFYYVNLFMYSGKKVYVRTNGAEMYSLPVNKFVGEPVFNAAPFMTSNTSQYLTMFNEDTKTFVMNLTIQGYTTTNVPVSSDPGAINYPVGHDLIWMAKSTSGNVYAVTKAPGGSFFLTRFQPGQLPNYSREITGTDIASAAHFAVSASPEYLFYSSGGKLYEYDLFTRTSKLMLDKGASTITYLDFVQFTPNRNTSTYGVWSRWLTVGSLNPAGAEGGNGTLEQYSVPDANDPLVLQKQWTGFGKITSVSFRER